MRSRVELFDISFEVLGNVMAPKMDIADNTWGEFKAALEGWCAGGYRARAR
jgi:hypothetical protein